jgi:hypothetical protein
VEDNNKPLAPGRFNRVDVDLRQRFGQVDVGNFSSQCRTQILDFYGH